MRYKNMVTFSHELIKPYLNENTICLDMTMGNGNDTLHLSKTAKKVYAFDIQKLAITNTTTLLSNNNITNAKLILDSHENYDQYVSDYDLVIFNLGYLPRSDKTITTNYLVTINTLTKLLNDNKANFICVVIYPGHHEGRIESEEIHKFTNTKLTNYTYKFHYNESSNKTSPYILTFKKE